MSKRNPSASPLKATDLNLFSAPIGTAASGYVEFGETTMAILPPPYTAPIRTSASAPAIRMPGLTITRFTGA